MKRRYRVSVGGLGEDFAASLLCEMGMSILERNYRCRLGEIDIIAGRENELHFVEVKTRVGDGSGTALEAVTPAKLEVMKKVSLLYIEQNGARNCELSFDAMAVQVDYVENIN